MDDVHNITINYMVRVAGGDQARRVADADKAIRQSAMATTRALEDEERATEGVTEVRKKDIDALKRQIAEREKSSSSTVKELLETQRLRRELDSMTVSYSKLSRQQRVVADDNDRVARSSSNLHTEMGKVNRTALFMSSIFRLIKWPAIIGGLGAATAGIAALGGGAIALVGAIGPAVGIFASMPSLLGAIIQPLITVKLAFGDLKQAMAGNAEAMKRLTPEARAFAEELKKMKPVMDSLRSAAGQELFPGLLASLKTITEGPFIGALRGILKETGAALGDVAQSFAKFVSDPAFSADFERFGKQNADVLRQLGKAAENFLGFITNLSIAAGPLTTWLGDMTIKLTGNMKAWSAAGRESGKLAEFFDHTKESLQALGSLLWNWTQSLILLGKAARPLGMEILKALNEEAVKFNEWASSTSGQSRLTAYFNDLKDPLFEIGRLLRDITRTFVSLSRDPNFTLLVNQVRTQLLPAFERLVRATSEALGPALVELIVQFGNTLSKLAGGSGPLTLFIKTFSRMLELFNKTMEVVPGLNYALLAFIGARGVLSAVKLAGAILGLGKILGFLRGIAAIRTGTGLVSLLSGGRLASTALGGGLGARLGGAISQIGVQKVWVVNMPLGGPAGLPVPGGRYPGSTPLPAPLGRGARVASAVKGVAGVVLAPVAIGLLAAELSSALTGRSPHWTTPGGASRFKGAGGAGTAAGPRFWGDPMALGQPGFAPGARPAAGGSGPSVATLAAAIRAAAGPGPGAGIPMPRNLRPSGSGLSGVATPAGVTLGIGAGKSASAALGQVQKLNAAVATLASSFGRAAAAKDGLFGAKVDQNSAEVNFLAAKRALEEFRASRDQMIKDGTMTQREANAQERVLVDQSKLTWKEYQAAIEAATKAKREDAAADAAKTQANRALNTALRGTTTEFRQNQTALEKSGAGMGAVKRNAEALSKAMWAQAASFKEPNSKAAIYARTVGELTTRLGRVPTKKEINMELKGDAAAKRRIDELQRKLNNLKDKSVTVRVAAILDSALTSGIVPSIFRGNNPVATPNVGGRIGGPIGAGDVVPAMLSPGEVVLTSSGQSMVEQMAGRGAISQVLARQSPHGGGRSADVSAVDLGGALGLAVGSGPHEAAQIRTRLATIARQLAKKTLPKAQRAALQKERVRLQRRQRELQRKMSPLPPRPTVRPSATHAQQLAAQGGVPTYSDFGAPPPPTAAPLEAGWTQYRRVSCPPGKFAWGGQCWGPGDLGEFKAWFAGHGSPRLVNAWGRKNPRLAEMIGFNAPEIPADRPTTGGDPGRQARTSPGTARVVGDRAFLPGFGWYPLHPKGPWGEQRKAASVRYGRVAGMIQDASRIAALGLQYTYSGGHQTPAPASGPFDCSSLVSRVLQSQGLLGATTTSGGFLNMGWPQGQGKWVTVWVKPGEGRNGHVYMTLNGRGFGTSGGSGGTWLPYAGRSGFIPVHPPGFHEGGIVRDMEGRATSTRNKGPAGDTVPIMATPGELILNAQQQERLAKILRHFIGDGAMGKGRRKVSDWLAKLLGVPMGGSHAHQGSQVHFHWFGTDWQQGEKAAFLAKPTGQAAFNANPFMGAVFSGGGSQYPGPSRVHIPSIPSSWGFVGGGGMAPAPPTTTGGGGTTGGGMPPGGATGTSLCPPGKFRFYGACWGCGQKAAFEKKLKENRSSLAKFCAKHGLACQKLNCQAPSAPPEDLTEDEDDQEIIDETIVDDFLGGDFGGGVEVPAPPSFSERLSALLGPGSHATSLAQVEYQRLQTQQRLGKTFDAGGAARSAFITSKLIPALETELLDLRGALAKVPGATTEERRSVELAILQKQLEIDEAKLEAMEQTAANTATIAEQLGRTALGFEYGGQRWQSDLSLGVGA